MDLNKTDDAFPSVLSDTSGLPYRVRTRGLALAYAIIICGMGLCVDGILAYQLLHDPDQAFQLTGLGVIAFGAACFFVLFRTFTPHVVFYSDRIEKRSLTGWQTLMRSDIEGVRSGGSDRAGAMFQLVPREGRGNPVVLRQSLRKDPVVIRWLRDVSDLDARDLAADTSAILTDPRYGATPAERQARLDNAKRVSFVFNLGCVAVAVGLFFLPAHYQAKLAVAAGAFAIAALLVQWSQGLLVWLPRTKARAGVLGAFAPAFAVAYQALDFDLLGSMPLVWVAGAGAIAVAAAFAPRNPGTWLTVPFMAFYGGLVVYGLAATVDVAFTPPSALVFPLLVNDMYTSGSKNRSYNLKVAAWDDQPAGPISVPSGYYDKVQIGSLVCVFRHKGGLGIDWIEVRDCPPGSKAPPAVLAQFAALPRTSPPPSAPAPSPPGYSGPGYYPERAMRAGKDGRAVVRCEVANGGLVDCRVQWEDPPGYGFGKAAVGRIMGTDGGGGIDIKPEQLKGRTEVDIPVNFKLQN